MADDNQNNVIRFPMLQKMVGAVKSGKQWLDDKTAEAEEGLARQHLAGIQASNPALSEEEAMQQAREYANLARSGGMTAGSINNLGAKAMAAGPGLAGVKQAQDMSRMMPTPGQGAGAAASKQIIEQETNYIREMAKQMAAKNKPKWGGQ